MIPDSGRWRQRWWKRRKRSSEGQNTIEAEKARSWSRGFLVVCSFISWFCIFGEISTAALNRLAIFYFLCFSIWLRQASTTMWLRRVWIWVKDDSPTKDLSPGSDRDAGWIDPQRLPYAILVAFPHCSTKHELQLPAVASPCPRVLVGVRWSRAGIDRHGSPCWEGHGSQAMNQAARGWNDNDLLEPRSKRSARIDQVADVEGLIFRNRSRVACHEH